MSASDILQHIAAAEFRVPDPGNGKTILFDRWGMVCPLVTAAAETRILARPLAAGLAVMVTLDVDGGDCVLTVTGGWNQAATATITFNTAGDWASFVSVKVGASFFWRLVSQEGTNAVMSSTGADFSFTDGGNLALGTVTGTQVATAADQKLGMWGVTPVIQQADAAQAAIAATLTDNTGKSGTHDDTLAAVTTFTPSVAWDALVHPSAADATAIATAITVLNQNASDTAQKVIQLVALVNSLQAALLAIGAIKGSA